MFVILERMVFWIYLGKVQTNVTIIHLTNESWDGLEQEGLKHFFETVKSFNCHIVLRLK